MDPTEPDDANEPSASPADPTDHPRGILLSDPTELLWRQIAAAFSDQEERPTYLAFQPTKKDHEFLSTRREKAVDAKKAYEEHQAAGMSTLGTWAVSVREALDADVPPYDGSALPGMPHGHTSLSFAGKSRRQAASAAKILLRAARDRGRCHP